MGQKHQGTQKTLASKRSINASKRKTDNPAPFQQHDPKRRLGSFGGTGEHVRTGNRGRQ